MVRIDVFRLESGIVCEVPKVVLGIGIVHGGLCV